MARANPPPQRVPRAFANDPALFGYFTELNRAMFLMWKRLGGSTDTVEETASDVEEISSEVTTNTTILAGGLSSFPVGSIWFCSWAEANDPVGWLPADGRTISRADFPEAFALWGETYGAGDGDTTFGIPNVPSGSAMEAGSTGTLGDSRGSETHLLTSEQSGLKAHVVPYFQSYSNNTAAAGAVNFHSANQSVNAAVAGSDADESHPIVGPRVAFRVIVKVLFTES